MDELSYTEQLEVQAGLYAPFDHPREFTLDFLRKGEKLPSVAARTGIPVRRLRTMVDRWTEKRFEPRERELTAA